MITKLRLVFSITILFGSFYGIAQQNYWKTGVLEQNSVAKSMQNIDANKAKTFYLDESAFLSKLEESNSSAKGKNVVYFPHNDGELEAFYVEEHAVFAPELALKYPNIKSYVGYGVKNSKERVRFSVSHKGVQSMIVHGDREEAIYMQPSKIKDGQYIVYGADAHQHKDEFVCDTKAVLAANKKASAAKQINDQTLRTYRIAISASGEYTTYHGGTVVDALAAINATLTRVNEVFETDLGIHLELIANTDQVIYTDASTDPYSGSLNTQAQNTFSTVIGSANYDVGHLFHQGPNGGNAGTVGSVCDDNWKGRAYSSRSTPEGDLFDVDFVAHEIGHQFGANHTWSFDSEGTLVQAEPASGSTIMGYAGIADGNNVQANGDDYFHYYSIFQIAEYVSSLSCGVSTSITNNPPVISPLSNYIIPKSTPFVLTGDATDPDTADVLTYTWEQIDNGVVTRSNFGPENPSGANFRSLKPTTKKERYFPKIERVIQGNLTQTNPSEGASWETISDVERDLNFALTVRDNVVGGGQVVSETMNVRVINSAGPFAVTSQSTNQVYQSGSVQQVTWDVAGTSAAPINTETVNIYLSIDSGLSFPTLLAENVVNDGSHIVQIPNVVTTTARIKVMPTNNVYYAINTTNFTINTSDVNLEFEALTYNVCQPNDVLVPFKYTVNNGFDETSTFSVFGAPANLGVNFSVPTADTNNTNVDLTFSNTVNVAPGTYEVTVLSNSTSNSTGVVLTLVIGNTTFADVGLISPGNGAMSVNMNQTLSWEENVAYSSYDLEIATDAAFTNIIETKSTPFTYYKPTSLQAETTYYWRVKPKSLCAEGTFGPAYSFTTALVSCAIKEADDLPKTIPTVGTSVLQSKITFLDDLPITDVNVTVDITHSFLSDLTVSLVSPQGTRVVLTSNSCGDFQDINAVFDDDSASFVCGSGAGAAIGGTVRPLGSLASLNGESILGEWILEVKDGASSDGGEIKDFNLEICVEGMLRPDADNDGVFDDGDDACLGTPNGVEVDVNGCAVYRFMPDNFAISVASEACTTSNDGEIFIDAIEEINYSVTITGAGVNITQEFTNTLTLDNLNAGIYVLCFTGTDGVKVYEDYCVTVVIKEPDVLSVLSAVTNRTLKLELSGAKLYNVELNGVLVQTTDKTKNLALKNGLNTIKVSTGLECQGVYEKQIYIAANPVISPNPTAGEAIAYLETLTGKVTVAIYTLGGQVLQQKKHTINNGTVTLDVSGLAKGVYVVKFNGAEVNGETKLIKK
ncbi:MULTISPECIES: reprolysin-like metallopeptidase [unclassified Cellulophaga]|uniref:reprolysin-like metallopeptidase n=1 Tax=unclassified Cellulophaga TaxID=2634405 RepID=UPI0026E4474A|nr:MULTISPECIES: zinc-dependent metalloprotease family protein [unclassified Cellulophaga]MDO6490157.1 zinc-dependent metalloprotease family protein [Cellulophaga sp. 2_MG-2023]MDO6494649.1 zinc-dependent metalloprotease family protein [Cellulophaga sp. 3_MG-2023]